MNKELTPLEVFNNLVERLVGGEHDIDLLKATDKEYLFIKTALKRLALFDDENVVAYLSRSDEKKLRALEIIKEKNVNIGSFIKCCSNIDYEKYINGWGNWNKDILYNLSKNPLTQEEFNLLKEVLL